MRRSIHAVAWVLLAACAFVLWPERWGGSMTYVITDGNSMAPVWQAGDLAVLRAADEYGVGDVAAYNSTDIKRIVMHRIEKESPEGYTFKGDNNDHLDPETVTDEQMLGKLLVRVPSVGTYLNWILKPVNLMIAAGALFLLFGDRKKDVPQPGVPRAAGLSRLRLTALELPAGTATATVADLQDLEKLAAHYDRPVLQVDGEDRQYVIDGAVVYSWVKVAARPNERRKTPQGRDWGYGARHLEAVPEPRHAEDVARVS
jgi:signal peptidase